MTEKRRALGTGLDKKLGQGLGAFFSQTVTAAKDNIIVEVAPDKLVPNKEQPRQNFDLEKLKELADSISAKGVLQPVLVERLKDDEEKYVIIAGERRWRAAKLAGFNNIPILIKKFQADEILEISLIENIQRSALNPLEEAVAYHKLIAKFGYTQENLAQRLGKSRPYIANSLRLLKLPTAVKKMLKSNQLTAGHGRALAALDEPELQTSLAKRTIAEHLSVRAIEIISQELKTSQEKIAAEAASKDKNRSRNPSNLSAGTRLSKNLAKSRIEAEVLSLQMQENLKSKVRLKFFSRNKGEIKISFNSLEEFNNLYDILTKNV